MATPYAHSLKLQFERMLLIRKVEEEIARRYSEQKMRCPVHLSIGQEAAAVGVCSPLKENDQIVSNHRCHAHYLAMGGDLTKMIAEIYGKISGCCGGRGGSMHLFDNDAGIRSSIPIVAGGIPLAAGIGLSHKLKKNGSIAVAIFGDGAIEEGVFHETFNFAKVKNIPVLFVCENNQFSVYTSLEERQPDDNMLRYAEANSVKNIRVTSHTASDISNATQELTDYIRAESKPAFLQVDTYRWLEHCGPNEDDHLNYRQENETEKWKNQCCIEALKDRLYAEKLLTQDEFSALSKNQDMLIANSFENAINQTFPHPDTAKDYVYA